MSLVVAKVGIHYGFKDPPMDVLIVSIHPIELFAEVFLISQFCSCLADSWEKMSTYNLSSDLEVQLCCLNLRVVEVVASKWVVTNKCFHKLVAFHIVKFGCDEGMVQFLILVTLDMSIGDHNWGAACGSICNC